MLLVKGAPDGVKGLFHVRLKRVPFVERRPLARIQFFVQTVDRTK